ncbi:hypothetical protein D3C86_1408720 [compost metagenome]
MATGMPKRARSLPVAQRAIRRRMARSSAITSSRFGRWTLTTTSSPECNRARWTWPMEAAESGVSSKEAKIAWASCPSSSRMIAMATRESKGGTRS